MRRILFFAVLCLSALPAQAAITRIAGPTDLLGESREFVRFDAAFDSVNRVYLMVWGTQQTGPVNGLFLNESGAPIGPSFPISTGTQQSGWARVIYSAEQQKFLVSYTKIKGGGAHEKLARFVTYAAGTASMGSEIWLDAWTGEAGNESGIAYSTSSKKFFVTWWWEIRGAVNPHSRVATLDPTGNVVNLQDLTNLADGQSDPEIACDPLNKRCLIVGWSWGVFSNGKTAIWARFIDDAGNPQGADSFYLPADGYLEHPTITFNATAGLLQVAYGSSGQIFGNTIDAGSSGVSGTYRMLYSTAATAAQDSGGYGFPTITYNAGSKSMALVARPYSGYPAIQEISSSGLPISGSLDFVPDSGGSYDLRNQYVIPVANDLTKQFLLLDNHYFNLFRVSLYSTDGTGAPPPPPPPPPPAGPITLSGLASSRAFPVLAGQPVRWTATASGGTGPLEYRFWRWRSASGWTVLRDWSTTNFAEQFMGAGWHRAQVDVRNAGGSDPAASLQTDLLYAIPNVALSLAGNTGSAFVHDGSTVRPMSATGVGYFTEWSSVPVSSFSKIYPGDFNGDGLSDFIAYNEATGETSRNMNTGSGFTANATSWAAGYQITVGDFNGDGLSDAFLYNPTTGGWARCLSNGSDLPCAATGLWSPSWKVYAGEFNGDGLTDLFLYNNNPATANRGLWYRVLSNASNSNPFSYIPGPLRWSTDWNVTIGDFDGDGLSDVFLYRSSGQWFRVKFTTTQADGFYSTGAWSSGWTIRAGEFNGDRNTDLFLYNPSTGRSFVVLSTSADFVYYEGILWGKGWDVTLTDFNGDGISDALLYNQATGAWSQATTLSPGRFGYSYGNFGGGFVVVGATR